MQHEKLIKTALILIILVLIVVILRYARPFLIPLTFAALFAMLLLPICLWLEKKGVNRALSTLLSILALVTFVAALIALVSWQAPDMGKSVSKIKEQAEAKYEQAQEFIREKLGIPPEKQKEMIKGQQPSGKSVSGMVAGILAGIGSILANAILVLVYVFLMIYFRDQIKRFILRLSPPGEKDKALDILDRSQSVAQKYLTGLSWMILSLWIMYGIGFSIVGVQNAIFFAILCGLLEMIPFVGNLVGNTLTMIMALVQGGGMHMVVGVLITYGIVQFLQSYILQPLVVGSEVNINPLFTIVGLIAGEIIWGIPGMILSIPVMGVAKIAFSHIEPLKPYAQFMGQEEKEGPTFREKIEGWRGKMKKWFK